MAILFSEPFLTALLFGIVTSGIPLLLAGLGEQISEKAGILNIGLEGMMLMGAYMGFLATYNTESFFLGFIAGSLGGMSLAAIVALLCVRYGLNQIVIGIGLTLGAQGITAMLHYFQFSRTYPRLSAAPTFDVPGLHDLPILGKGLFGQNGIVYFAIALVPLLAWIFRSLHAGIILEAAGSNPAALDVAGVSVTKTRIVAVLSTGLLAGLGGATLANIGAGLFVPFMTNGAGFMAIVLAMIARGKPFWVLLGAFLFGLSLAITTTLQVAGLDIPTDLVQMLPFFTVILMLVIFARQSILPAALGQPYIRGER